MHIGRPLLMLKRYLDLRLSGAPAWQRVAAVLGLTILCLALIPVGILTGHYVLSGVGVLLALVMARQGVVAASRSLRTPRTRRSLRKAARTNR